MTENLEDNFVNGVDLVDDFEFMLACFEQEEAKRTQNKIIEPNEEE